MLTEEQKDALALYGVPGVGARTYARLMERFGSPAAVFSAPKSALVETEGIGSAAAAHIHSFDRHGFVSDQIRFMETCGATLLTRSSEEYPKLLNTFRSAPPVLFVRGDPTVFGMPTVAVVGTRRPTDYGIKMTRMLVSGMIEAGMCVVSGMAVGIDSVAHSETLDRSGKTIAVFGCGVDVIYPTVNRKLASDILRSGCLVSQFPMGTECRRGTFPARNAVIVGLSQGTVVVEAPIGSGALITADLTLRAGRKLFAVPGNIGSRTSAGTNNLFARGALPACDSGAVLAGLGRAPRAGAPRSAIPKDIRPKPPGLSGDIVELLRNGPMQLELICSTLGKPVADILNELTYLEMDSYVIQRPGKVFEKA